MTDEELEKVKEFFLTYKDIEDFKENYINVYHPHNEVALLQIFDQAHGAPLVWDISKKLRSTETINLFKELRDIDNLTIDDVVNKAKEYDLSKYKRIMIKLDNKNYDDIDKLSTLGVEVCILVKDDAGYCTIDEFKRMRDFFSGFIEQYSPENLSTLEKVTLAYDHAKFFEYNEEETDRKTDSRSIIKSLETGNIVCLGYSRIFCQLLREMGIKSNIIYTKPNEKCTGGHARVILNVDDKKYGTSGPYIFDPTWDSDMKTELVTHSDGTTGYVNIFSKKEDDKTIEKMPSSIRYGLYMIPIFEYSQYFPKEEIDKIEKYPTRTKIDLNDVMYAFSYNQGRPLSTDIINILPNVLRVTKKIEGYSDEEIEKYISNAMAILKETRYKGINFNDNNILK